MKKHLNIFSLVMLVVYGTLALVAVPLHHHVMDYVDTPHYQSVTIHHGDGCDVCTFASLNIIHQASVHSFIAAPVIKHLHSHTTLLILQTDFVTSHPHRGPPVIFS